MRFADIVLDLAAVLNASRSVASKHVALRARQLDRYSRASSIVRDLRQQQPQQRPSERSPDSDTDQSSVGKSQDAVVPESKPAESDAAEPVAACPPSKKPLSSDSIGDARTVPTPLSARQTPASSSGPESRPIVNDLAQRIIQQAAEKGRGPKSSSKPLDIPQRTPPAPSPRGEEAVKDAEAEEEVPEGININIFQTARGSQILDALKTKASVNNTEAKATVGQRTAESWKPHPLAGTPLASKTPEIRNTPKPLNTEAPKVSLPEQKPNETRPPVQTTSAAAPAKPVAAANPAPANPFLTNPDPAQPAPAEPPPVAPAPPAPARPTYQLRESKVPATRLSRIWNYSGLAAGMLGGALSESISRSFGGGSSQGSVLLSPANMERLVSKLSRMRGAALKMGQAMSFQDDKMLPGPIQQVLQRVQDRADYMPAWQRDRVLVSNLGADWRERLFDTFDETPIAAASIGQVHRATLKKDRREVAVKIQFPGVADSINSDLDNIGMLLTATKLLPKGLYLDKTIANARTELAWECDYEREAACLQRYRELLLSTDDEAAVFTVPDVIPEASGKHVLTMEFMSGVGVTRVESFTQPQRDWIGTQILRLCLREITEFRFMQTDPNWTNFLYNSATDRLELLDFGASREYPREFVELYVRLLHGASTGDRAAVKDFSERLGYLTGLESRAMLDAHVQSVLTLAEPFLGSAPEVYDFRDQTITQRVRALIPFMVRERLAPPPEETYSLHRKLSGAFLLCARLGSRVRCREMFEDSVARSGLVPGFVKS